MDATMDSKSVRQAGDRSPGNRGQASATWVGSRVGISDEVLEPWTPIHVETVGRTISVQPWGRSYEFDELPFPSRIQTAGHDILAGPIRLMARVGDRDVTWSDGPVRLMEQSPDRVRLSSIASSEPLALSAEIDVEYDGAIRVDWMLQPRRAVRLEALTFEIPLRSEYAKFLYWFQGTFWTSDVSFAGPLLPVGHTAAFRPYIWIGNEDRGLAWFCESDENWFAADRHLVTEIRRTFNSTDQCAPVILRLNVVDAPVDLDPAANPAFGAGATSRDQIQKRNSLAYSFGLQATPVKPITKDVWDYRLFHVDAILSKDGIDTSLRIPEETLDQLAAAGVRTLAFHEHWTDIEAYVATNYGEELKRLVQTCHERGMHVLLYLGFLISDLAPEWPAYGDECVVTPRGGYEPYDYSPQPRQNAYRVCYNSVWQDRIAVGLADMMDKYDIDGVYLDGTEYPAVCTNRRHGCGYLRADGSVAPTCPIWAVRSMMKRIYSIVKSRKRNGQVNVHNSTCMTIPTLGWATSYWDGEQFRDLSRNLSATNVLSLDVFRTEFMGHQWGVPAEFLSYEKDKFFTFREAYAITLLHDVITRSYSIGPGLELNSALWRLSDAFRRREAEWLPYWRNAEYVSVQPDGIYASVYRHSDTGILMVISNLGREEVTAQVQLNLENLGLRNDLSACDALTREEIAAEGGTFTLALKSLGWKIIWIR
jgi:hypothetical protein